MNIESQKRILHFCVCVLQVAYIAMLIWEYPITLLPLVQIYVYTTNCVALRGATLCNVQMNITPSLVLCTLECAECCSRCTGCCSRVVYCSRRTARSCCCCIVLVCSSRRSEWLCSKMTVLSTQNCVLWMPIHLW